MPSPGVVAEGGGFWSSPLAAHGWGGEVSGDVIFVCGPDGTIFAFNADGAPRYHFTAVGMNQYGVDSAGAVRADGTFFVGVSAQ